MELVGLEPATSRVRCGVAVEAENSRFPLWQAVSAWLDSEAHGRG